MPLPFPRLRARLLDSLFGDLLAERVQHAVKVVDNKWWNLVGDSNAPNDLRWIDRAQDLSDALDAWRYNPLARQIVRLTRGFVLQDGITFKSNKRVEKFVQAFWNEKMSQLPSRLSVWCDALTINGEVFPVLFTNQVDGMSYVRSVPASRVSSIMSKDGDYEHELSYTELVPMDLSKMNAPETREWVSSLNPAWAADKPEMLHFAVNRPEGATRGSGDLDPVLTWLKRYKQWLIDRAIINEAKAKYVWDLSIQGADEMKLKTRQRELSSAVFLFPIEPTTLGVEAGRDKANNGWTENDDEH